MDRVNSFGLRMKVYKVMHEWMQENRVMGAGARRAGYNQDHLSVLLGSPVPLDAMNDAQVDACKKLLGPNGYAYYRALLIKRGIHEQRYFPS